MIKQKLANFFLQKQLSEMGRLRNIHNGEACYIFGDGPSIKWIDFTQFSDKPSICCGMIPFHRDFHLLDVKYCSLIEPWLFCPDWLKKGSNHKRVHLKELSAMAKNYSEVIVNNPDKSFFVHISNNICIPCAIISLYIYIF